MEVTRPSLFDDRRLDSDHPWYVACRDRKNGGIRRSLSRIWNRRGDMIPEDPKQFVTEFRRDFPARTWELFVLDYLARSGARLERSPRAGPDFCATLPGVGRFWVECVVPRHGSGQDGVPERTEQRSGSLGPSTPVALRYTNAISTKIKKLRDYRAKRIIGADEPVLIALNQGGIELSDLHDTEVPLVVRVLFGIGEPVMRVDPYEHTSRVEVPPMDTVKKRSGEDVTTTIFLNESSAAVSGLLFARRSISNLFPIKGKRLYLAHNPMAALSFARGALPLRGEVWVDDEQLAHSGVVSDYGWLSKRRPWSRVGPEK